MARQFVLQPVLDFDPEFRTPPSNYVRRLWWHEDREELLVAYDATRHGPTVTGRCPFCRVGFDRSLARWLHEPACPVGRTT